MKKNIILIAIILINILALENPSFAYRAQRASARQKSCFSNQRVLLGAIEMYYMDHNSFFQTYLPGGDFEELQNLLIKEKYLKSFIEGPEFDCSYGFIVKDSEKFDYDIFCKRHGTTATIDMDNPIIPSYNVYMEKPFSGPYQAKINAKRREIAISHFLNNYVLTFPTLVLIIFGITVASGVGKKNKKE